MALEAAAVETPTEGVTAPEAPTQDVDVTESGHQEFVFLRSEEAPAKAPESKEETPPAPDAEPAGAAPEPKPDPEPTDEDLERVLKHPKAQERIDRLAANKAGNLQQQRERDRAERDSKKAEATSYYEKLANDDFYEAQVKGHGEARILRWLADYKEAISEPDEPSAPVDTNLDSFKDEFTAEFNRLAIPEFQATVAATIPIWKDLPEAVHKQIGGLRFDPNGNWLADGLTAIGKGIADHIAKLERDHKAALDQAREAGRNEAHARREEASPVVVDARPGEDPGDIVRRYADGDPAVTRDQYRRALAATGKSY